MTWCANGYSFDQVLQEGGSGSGATVEQICEGPTACVGEQISNFQVTSCTDGEPVGMRDYFEGADVGLYWYSPVWRMRCAHSAGVVFHVAKSRRAYRFLLGETRNRTQPDQLPAVCALENIPLESIFIDHDGTYSHSAFFETCIRILQTEALVCLSCGSGPSVG